MKIELTSGGRSVELDVDPTDSDATVTVLYNGLPVVGVNPFAGTVGVWPDGESWSVVNRFDPATGAPDDRTVDLVVVVDALAEMGVDAFIEQVSPDGVVSIFVDDGSDGPARAKAVAGPGYVQESGWPHSRAYLAEFTASADDDLSSPMFSPPGDATEADVARMIAHVLRGTPPIVDGKVPAYETNH